MAHSTLVLNSNSFSGTIPDGLTGLSALTYVDGDAPHGAHYVLQDSDFNRGAALAIYRDLTGTYNCKTFRD